MFLPENIDLSQSNKYSLSIRLVPNGFSFSIYTTSDTPVFYYKNTEFNNDCYLIDNIKKVFFEVNFFSHSFKNISVTQVTPRYTLVPEKYFEVNTARKIFEYNFCRNAGTLQHTFLPQHKSYLIYDIDDEVHSFLFRNLWNPSFECFASSLITFFSSWCYDDSTKRCFIEYHDEMVTIVFFQGKTLLSMVTESNIDQNDSLYYIVNMCEVMQFNQNSDQLYISGQWQNNIESVSILKKLVKNITEITIPTPYSINLEKKILSTDILLKLCE